MGLICAKMGLQQQVPFGFHPLGSYWKPVAGRRSCGGTGARAAAGPSASIFHFETRLCPELGQAFKLQPFIQPETSSTIIILTGRATNPRPMLLPHLRCFPCQIKYVSNLSTTSRGATEAFCFWLTLSKPCNFFLFIFPLFFLM